MYLLLHWGILWAEIESVDGHFLWYPGHVGWCLSENGEVSLQESDKLHGLLAAELSAYLHFLFWIVCMDDYLLILLGPLEGRKVCFLLGVDLHGLFRVWDLGVFVFWREVNDHTDMHVSGVGGWQTSFAHFCSSMRYSITRVGSL